MKASGVCCLLWLISFAVANAQSLPGTAALTGTNDLADVYMGGLERFMHKETQFLASERLQVWKKQFASGPAEAARWVAAKRQHLARVLGVRDERIGFDAPTLVSSLARSAVLGETDSHVLMEIRWPVVGGFQAEGLLLEPKSKLIRQSVIHIPHAGVTPEQILGLVPGVKAVDTGFIFPSSDCRMILPAVVSRKKTVFESVFKKPGKGQLPGRMRMPNREFVYRPAYVMGRHIIGYEIQAVLALVDWLRKEDANARVRVEGWGDGGMLAFYSGALDARISDVSVAGYFDQRNDLWQEPIDRNVFGLLRCFGDAEIATLIAPRKLRVIAVPGPVETITREMGKEGGAPGRLVSPQPDAVAREAADALECLGPLFSQDWLTVERSPRAGETATPFRNICRLPDADQREKRLVEGMNGFSQHLLSISASIRRDFMERLDTSSLEAYDRSAEWYRDYYREEIMGRIQAPKLPFNVRSRSVEETAAYVCHEIVIDVLTDFILEGFLLIPKGIREGEKRPVVVAQHGRGGTPRTLMALTSGGRQTYYEIAPRLAERGYIVFSPQNPYIFEDRYRQLGRRANAVKLSLYSIIYAQYEQMFEWFKTLPQVDLEKVAFIGQSYGGKTAVRVPPVMPGFCLAISTGDFNEGLTKMASTLFPFSFALWDEYEMFEFDLGNTFNYSDLANLMAPRPFMVERGHTDGVAWDEFVGYEYALVRQRYAKLKIPDRTEIFWFDGGHEIAVEPAIAFFDRFMKVP
jgi:cephalosporin-C deacetylase-like acetyl esterase